MNKIRLGVNIDHVATLRQLRAGLVDYPNIIEAAEIVKQAGADQITVHLRGDRRHIQEDDLVKLTSAKLLPINLEMAATEEMIEMALRFKPSIVCLVPEKREEITTEGGLDVIRNQRVVGGTIATLQKAGIKVSLFIEASLPQIDKSHELKANAVEFHTGRYALNKTPNEIVLELQMLRKSFAHAHEKGLAVHAGHGLDYRNTSALLGLEFLEEVNIGHSIICRAVIVGLSQAVSEMKKITQQ
jgi:pyridoxine 5-phosphate synthase